MTINNPHLHKPQWPVKNILAFTTTRKHPSALSTSVTPSIIPSMSPYDEFNLGFHVGDKTGRVSTNRSVLKAFLPKQNKIQWLEQVHGADVIEVTRHTEQALIADAAITREPDIALAVMTADCLPILLSSVDGKEISVIHGGWRPLFLGIIANTLQQMKTTNNKIHAWLGPCISEQVFEVGGEVRQAFVAQSDDFIRAFENIGQDKYLANLSLIAQIQLKSLGVQHSYRLSHCTYQQKDEYYSYRRDGVTGRMATVIARL